jgi:dipeptidyl aminopeptidase/acylaminoacyl peptidase
MRILVLYLVVSAAAYAQNIPLKRIFDTPAIAGSRPSIAALSPDGRELLYFWDSSANKKPTVWRTRTSGGESRQVLDTSVASVCWSPDGKRIAFLRDGDIFLSDASLKNPLRITKTDEGEGQLAFSNDGSLLAYSSGAIFAMPVDRPGLFQLTPGGGADISYSVQRFLPDGKRLLFLEYNRQGLPEFVVPRYGEKEVTAQRTQRGFARVRVGIAPVDTGATLWLKLDTTLSILSSVLLSPDGKKVLLEQYSTNRKVRKLVVCDTDSGAARIVYSEYDSTYIQRGDVGCGWSADGLSIIFTSERDGWNHLYRLTGDSTRLSQLTHGAREVQWFAVDRNGKRIVFVTNAIERGQWQVHALDLQSGKETRISAQEGTYESPVLSEDGKTIVCTFSNFGRPGDLVAFREGSEKILTQSIPGSFAAMNWVLPRIVQFTARDSTTVSALLYTPATLDPTKRYPCVVFVHGAGYMQNVYKGWSYYFREFMFNTYLVKKGYVVFEVDYRGSAGYGRKFRTDVYMHLGGRDLNDELDGVEYLKRLGYIDSTRIGMYGGSYGGFLPLMALFTSPDTYACAAVLRAVTNWENYYRHNPYYTEALLGKPEENPEAYKISSPITFADNLKKPLLILHGMVDDNVFFQDAAQLIEKLQKAGKSFEAMVYPGEGHAFEGAESWYDEYRRMDEFFDRHLLQTSP